MNIASLLETFRPLIELFGDRPWLKALMALLIAFAIANLVSFIITRLIKLVVERSRNHLDDEVLGILRIPVYWTVIMVGVIAGLSLLDLPGNTTRVSQQIIMTVLISTWSIFAARLLRIIIKAVGEKGYKHSIIQHQTLPLFNNLAGVFVLLLAIYLVFDTWNIDMTAWLASAGIIGIAVGFAAKDTLANLFAGVLILADAPYKIGDYIVLESGERGKVTHIGIRSSRILTRDDVEVTIPNSIMGNTRVINESGGPHEKFRIRVPVGVAYGSDIDQVKAVLLSVAQNEVQVCTDPEPRVRFRRFGASSLDLELLCWVYNPELRGRVVDILNTAIYKQFMQQGIEIPYSKHDVFIKQMPHE